MNLELLFAYAGLFVTSFLAATVLPLSSEVALVALVRLEQALLGPVLVATAGNYLGACTTYWLARRAAAALSARAEPGERSARVQRAAGLMRRFGAPILLLSWVPALGDALVALAGASAIPFGPFSLWVGLGKLLRYAAVAWAALAL